MLRSSSSSFKSAGSLLTAAPSFFAASSWSFSQTASKQIRSSIASRVLSESGVLVPLVALFSPRFVIFFCMLIRGLFRSTSVVFDAVGSPAVELGQKLIAHCSSFRVVQGSWALGKQASFKTGCAVFVQFAEHKLGTMVFTSNFGYTVKYAYF